MTDTVYVTSTNPVNFLIEFGKEVKAGAYAYETRECLPGFDLINEVLLIKGDKPEQRHDLSSVEQVYIQGFNEVTFLQDVQDAFLQGFEVDPQTVDITGITPLFSVLMVRPAKEEKKAPVRATDPALKVPEAEPASDAIPETPAEPAKAPVKRGGRPPKAKVAE